MLADSEEDCLRSIGGRRSSDHCGGLNTLKLSEHILISKYTTTKVIEPHSVIPNALH